MTIFGNLHQEEETHTEGLSTSQIRNIGYFEDANEATQEAIDELRETLNDLDSNAFYPHTSVEEISDASFVLNQLCKILKKKAEDLNHIYYKIEES